jgi:hypothetical protein
VQAGPAVPCSQHQNFSHWLLPDLLPPTGWYCLPSVDIEVPSAPAESAPCHRALQVQANCNYLRQFWSLRCCLLLTGRLLRLQAFRSHLLQISHPLFVTWSLTVLCSLLNRTSIVEHTRCVLFTGILTVSW